MTSKRPRVHLHFLLHIVDRQTVTMLHRACVTERVTSRGFKLVKITWCLQTNDTQPFSDGKSLWDGLKAVSFTFRMRLFRSIPSSPKVTRAPSLLEIENSAEQWMRLKKAVCGAAHVPAQILTSYCWQAPHKRETYSNSLLSCAAQEFAFPFYTFRSAQRIHFDPGSWIISVLVSWAESIQLFKGMQTTNSCT